jgi:hypothetical protein
MGGWGDGEMGRWGDGEKSLSECEHLARCLSLAQMDFLTHYSLLITHYSLLITITHYSLLIT